MSEPKDSRSFFRKVVKFVANPATDWSNLGTDSPDARDIEAAKSELKAMIERKRRNDFVRKREFDMLRKVRREGLTSEQVAALDPFSGLDDPDARVADRRTLPQGGVKAKIDQIEQQMVGVPGMPAAASRRPSSDLHDAPTMPAPLADLPAAPPAPAVELPSLPPPAPVAEPLPPLRRADAQRDGEVQAPPWPFGSETRDVAHDPDLDEAVIAFANADFDQCEQALIGLVGAGGARARQAETWLALFDFYRATGRQQKFESLAIDYAQQFGWSAPQWYSLPKLAAEAAAVEPGARPHVDGHIGWACPAVLDAEGVARLAAQTAHMPLPWVFDWSALTHIGPDACARLDELMRGWAGQALDMRWLAGAHLLDVLQDATPSGGRDVHPAIWQLRLDLLRMVHRPTEFDDAAIEYCVTYEVSPPSWEPVRCKVRLGSTGSELDHSTQPPLTRPGDTSDAFAESSPPEAAGRAGPAGSVELIGQLVGDIGPTLERFDRQLGASKSIRVSCACLIRVDFLAAGDLLNWVLARRTEGRSIIFTDAHRLIALFFGAMGIDEQARVQVRST